MTYVHPPKESITNPRNVVYLIDCDKTLHAIYITPNKSQSYVTSMVRLSNTLEVSTPCNNVLHGIRIAVQFNRQNTKKGYSNCG